MSATQAQYNAATVAISHKVDAMVESLSWFEQSAVRKYITTALLHQFAVAAVDAALAIPAVSVSIPTVSIPSRSS